jgi:hypothetical protein
MDINEKDVNLNRLANERFNVIKDRLKLKMFSQVVERSEYPAKNVDAERIQRLLDHPEFNDKFEVKEPEVQKQIEENREYVNESFSFIQQMQLPAKLALAVAHIISSNKKLSEADLLTAIQILHEHQYETYGSKNV